jgi:uncharacterized protein (DUF1778 family)
MTSERVHQKSERLQIRLTPQQKDILSRAAQLKQTTVTNFILEKSCEAAGDILAEQTFFSLSDEAWEAFCDALESSPKDIPELRKLLTEPSIFDVK